MDEAARPLDAETNLTHAVLVVVDGGLRSLSFVPPTWDQSAYAERLKASARAIGDAFERYPKRAK